MGSEKSSATGKVYVDSPHHSTHMCVDTCVHTCTNIHRGHLPPIRMFLSGKMTTYFSMNCFTFKGCYICLSLMRCK